MKMKAFTEKNFGRSLCSAAKRAAAVCFLLLAASLFANSAVSSANASKKALKALKGTWVTAGQSAAEVRIFTKKYVKYYTLWNKSMTKVTKVKRYRGKERIVYTKKKGKDWYVKLAGGNYYIGHGGTMLCRWKDKGEWQLSGSSSIERVSKKEIYKKK